MTLNDDDYKSRTPVQHAVEIGPPVAQPLRDHCKTWRSQYEARRSHGQLTAEQRAAVDRLVSYGEERICGAKGCLDFETGDDATEVALNDIQQHPHIFVLGCVMDRRIKASRAWRIPVEIGKELGGLSFSSFAAASEGSITALFKARNFHRNPETMASCFYRAIRHIEDDWNGDVSQIWSKGPSAATVIRRFLALHGVGVKIANMAAIILAREFQIPMLDYASIDIAPDTRVRKFFEAYGMLKTDKTEEILYLARDLYPWFPGMLDIGAWEWNRRA